MHIFLFGRYENDCRPYPGESRGRVTQHLPRTPAVVQRFGSAIIMKRFAVSKSWEWHQDFSSQICCTDKPADFPWISGLARRGLLIPDIQHPGIFVLSTILDALGDWIPINVGFVLVENVCLGIIQEFGCTLSLAH